MPIREAWRKFKGQIILVSVIFLVAVAIAFSAIAAVSKPGPVSPLPGNIATSSVTEGNHTYLRMSEPGYDYIVIGSDLQSKGKILKALTEWEKANPEKEVTSWSLDYSSTVSGNSVVVGIWINHQLYI